MKARNKIEKLYSTRGTHVDELQIYLATTSGHIKYKLNHSAHPLNATPSRNIKCNYFFLFIPCIVWQDIVKQMPKDFDVVKSNIPRGKVDSIVYESKQLGQKGRQPYICSGIQKMQNPWLYFARYRRDETMVERRRNPNIILAKPLFLGK